MCFVCMFLLWVWDVCVQLFPAGPALSEDSEDSVDSLHGWEAHPEGRVHLQLCETEVSK